MKRTLIVLILPFLAGCAHTVNYKLTESDKWMGPKINGIICVQPFVDETAAITNKEEHINKEVWRTNYRKGYDNTNLSTEVTAMIAKHLAYSGLFTKVVSGTETNADYFLSGTLTDFQTHGKANTKAEDIQAVSAGFGLIGALVGSASTSGMKSEIKTSVTLNNLKLTDTSSQILWRDSISISNDVTTDFEEANEIVIFNRPDQALKDAVNEMIRRLGNSSLTNRIATINH